MSNKILLDSSLLIEYRKGANTDLFEAIIANENWYPFISQTVVSEYLFFHLAIFSGKSPLAVKTAAQVAQILTAHPPEPFLQQFNWLEDDQNLPDLSAFLMKSYNLLSNDALIIAICKIHNIGFLASFDPDYEQVCRDEKIQLIRSIEDFGKL